MPQVGTIKGYHGGATYSLANVYDEKLTEINILAGTSAKELVSISFNTDTGVDYYFDSDMLVSNSNIKMALYQSGTSVTVVASISSATPDSGKKIIPYLSNEHAVSSSGYAFNHVSSRWLVIGQQPNSYTTQLSTTPKTFVLVPQTQNPSISPSHETEGWFFVDTSSIKKSNKTYQPRFLWSIPVTYRKSNASSTSYGNVYTPVPSYDLNAGTAASFQMYGDANTALYTYVRELPSNFFSEPFHLRVQWFNPVDNPKYVYLAFVNGELLFYKKRPENLANDESATQYDFYYWDNIVMCAHSSYSTSTKKYGFLTRYSGIHVSSFRASLLSPVYQKITPSNLPIRHNNAKCYIPLTTDKSNTSAPCLAVRHGSTNYYAVK